MDYFSRNPDGKSPSRPEALATLGRPQTAPGTPGPLPSPNPNAAMRIRRLPSSQIISPTPPSRGSAHDASDPVQDLREGGDEARGRRRSSSEPQRPAQFLDVPSAAPQLRRQHTSSTQLPTVTEENSLSNPATQQPPDRPNTLTTAPSRIGRLRSASNAMRGIVRRERSHSSSLRNSLAPQPSQAGDYESEVVDFLDVVDPEVSTLTSLNNVQNSLFIPYLGRRFNRQPTYDLSRPGTTETRAALAAEEIWARSRAGSRVSDTSRVSERYDATTHPEIREEETIQEKPEETYTPEEYEEREEDAGEATDAELNPRQRLDRLHTVKSTLSGMSVGHNYAVLPHGVRLEGWSQEELEDLNDHVRHLMHSRREGFKRSMRAFGKYVQKPMGFFVTAYAVTITFWGAAWVIFLIGWIHVGDRRDFWVDVCDQILTAMLVVFGIGLSPWRVVDTYHMIFIAKYSHKLWKLRQDQALPELEDPNDLPETRNPVVNANSVPAIDEKPDSSRNHSRERDVEANLEKTATDLLTPEEVRKLKHHQDVFAKRHTYYKPHETSTHHAFSIKLMIAIVVILDFHSIFQYALGLCTWIISYKVRPEALTASILACSLSCNITGGILVSIGDKRARKKEVFEELFRQARTDEAVKRFEKGKGLKVDRTAAPASAKSKKKKNKEEKTNVVDQVEKDLEQARDPEVVAVSRVANTVAAT